MTLKWLALATMMFWSTHAISDEPKPPMSEIFQAMAEGVLEPYQRSGILYSTSSYDNAAQQAAMYRAIAEVYRRYESTTH